MIVLRRPTYVWPRLYADPFAGVDDAIARAALGGYTDGETRFAIGEENRKWCDLLHRGRGPA